MTRFPEGAARLFEDWLPVLLYLALVFTLSSIPALAPPGGFEAPDKLWHVGEYAALGLLLRRALERGRPVAAGPGTMRGRLMRALFVIVVGSLVAVLDENFQRLVGRQYSIGDMAADAIGVALSQPAYELLSARLRAAETLR
jgi:VanZ family protein